jgi:hypothetical protein
MRAIVFLSHNGRTTWVLIPHDMASQLTVNQDQLNAAAHRALSHVNLTFADERGVEWREEAVFSAPTNFWVTFKLCPGGKGSNFLGSQWYVRMFSRAGSVRHNPTQRPSVSKPSAPSPFLHTPSHAHSCVIIVRVSSVRVRASMVLGLKVVMVCDMHQPFAGCLNEWRRTAGRSVSSSPFSGVAPPLLGLTPHGGIRMPAMTQSCLCLSMRLFCVSPPRDRSPDSRSPSPAWVCASSDVPKPTVVSSLCSSLHAWLPGWHE